MLGLCVCAVVCVNVTGGVRRTARRRPKPKQYISSDCCHQLKIKLTHWISLSMHLTQKIPHCSPYHLSFIASFPLFFVWLLLLLVILLDDMLKALYGCQLTSEEFLKIDGTTLARIIAEEPYVTCASSSSFPLSFLKIDGYHLTGVVLSAEATSTFANQLLLATSSTSQELQPRESLTTHLCCCKTCRWPVLQL